MDKVEIRIVRSDQREFKIDGSEWKILYLEGFGTYENDITMIDNAIGDGGIYGSEHMASKDRTITAKSRNPVLNEVLRKAALSFFSVKYLYKVYLTYMGETRWCEGKIYKFDLSTKNIHRTMTMTVTFLFTNPYLKSYDNFGKNIASISSMCAFPYMCSMTDDTPKGITSGIYNFAQKIELVNDGDVDAYCKAVFTAKGNVKNPKLIINGNYVRVLDTMIDGDIIIIDFAQSPPTVQKNGVNYIGHCDRLSAFDKMSLPVGDSEVSFDADDGGNLVDVSLYYNKLYGAI